MRMKRHYRKPEGWVAKHNVRGKDGKLLDPSRIEGELLNPPPISHVTVVDSGTHAEQNFSEHMVKAGTDQGFMSLNRGVLTLHTPDGQEDLVYTVKRAPGYYCCHCGEALPDAGRIVREGVTSGMAHVLSVHGAKSPDPNNPAGYMKLNAYECVLDAKQHAKYRKRSLQEIVQESKPKAA